MASILENPDYAGYGGICAVAIIAMDGLHQFIAADLEIVLIASKILLAFMGSYYYYKSTKKLNKPNDNAKTNP
jgi:hypothetical protein